MFNFDKSMIGKGGVSCVELHTCLAGYNPTSCLHTS